LQLQLPGYLARGVDDLGAEAVEGMALAARSEKAEADAGDRLAQGVDDRRTDPADAGIAFLDHRHPALAAMLGELAVEVGARRKRPRRQAGEAIRAEDLIDLVFRHRHQHSLAERSGADGQAVAGRPQEADRLGSFAKAEDDHLIAVELAEIGGEAGTLGGPFHRLVGDPGERIVDEVERPDLAGGNADPIAAGGRRPLEEAGTLEG